MKPIDAGKYELGRISKESPWQWLSRGWQDLQANLKFSLLYGLIFAGVALLMLYAAIELEMSGIIMALASGFMLVGPMIAMGLYEASRRRERGLPVTFRDMLFVKAVSPLQLLYLGLLLTLIFLLWLRLATMLHALFFGLAGFPPLEELLPTLLYSTSGPIMLAIGTIVGGVLAFLVFSVSAISAPMMMHRDADVLSAVYLSVKAVKENFWPMIVWAWLIGWFMAFGIVTGFVGFVIVFPLLGHATWHCYRDFQDKGF